MSFTIKCNECGKEQVLTKEKMYDTKGISITVDPWNDEHWRSVTIACENDKCENYV